MKLFKFFILCLGFVDDEFEVLIDVDEGLILGIMFFNSNSIIK